MREILFRGKRLEIGDWVEGSLIAYPDGDCCTAFEAQKKFRVVTNADHIRSLSDEELAKILLEGCRGSKCDDQPQNEYGSVNCFQCRMNWLKQPYKDGGTNG